MYAWKRIIIASFDETPHFRRWNIRRTVRTTILWFRLEGIKIPKIIFQLKEIYDISLRRCVFVFLNWFKWHCWKIHIVYTFHQLNNWFRLSLMKNEHTRKQSRPTRANETRFKKISCKSNPKFKFLFGEVARTKQLCCWPKSLESAKFVKFLNEAPKGWTVKNESATPNAYGQTQQ